MNLVQLNLKTLDVVKSLLKGPSQKLPDALSALSSQGHWNLLTQKVGSNLAKVGEAELTLPLLGESATGDGFIGGDWKWSGEVEANADLAIDLLTDEDLTNLPIKPDSGHTLIVYGGMMAAGGKLGASTKNLPWGSVAVEADGKLNAAVRWFVQARDNDSLIAAVDDAKDHFVWPYDLQGMLRLAGRTDWFGLEYELDGEAQLGIEVDASVAGTGWTFNLDGEQSSVGLSFGIKAGYKLAHKSRWKLSAMVEPRSKPGGGKELGLRVKLHDLKQSSRNASLGIAAGADFSAVAASAERMLRAAWPDLKNIELLDALTQPGTAIMDKLRDLVDKHFDGALQQLVTLLIGGEPSKELRDSLVNKLTFGLADTLDGAWQTVAGGQGTVEKTVAEWLARLLGKWTDTVELDEAVNDFVAQAIADATAGTEKAINDLKDLVFGKAKAEVDKVLQNLGELGAQFDAGIRSLDENVVSTSIRTALEKYASKREELLAVLSESQRLKLSLALSASFSRETATEAAFDAWFRPDDIVTPEAELLFNMLCGGRLLALPELVQAAASTGAIADVKGWLLSSVKVLNEQRVTLNFFGFKFENSTTWLRNVIIETDLVTGDLMAVNAIGSVKTTIANPWKNRSALLSVQLELVGVDSGGPKRLAAALNGAFTAKQEKTKRSKVQDLLNAYADATGTQRSDIGLFLDVPSESDAEGTRRFWNGLTIAVPVALSAHQWKDFSGLDAHQIEKVSLEFASKQFERRYITDSLFSNDPLDDLLGAAVNAGESTVLAFLKRFPAHHVGKFSAADEATKLNMEVTSLHSDRGVRRFMAYQRLSATVQAPLRLRTLAVEANGVLDKIPDHPDPATVRKLLEPFLIKIQSVLEPVALVSETWSGLGLLGAKDEPVAWPFVSFITTMAKLSGLPVPPGFVPIAQVRDKPAVRLIAAG